MSETTFKDIQTAAQRLKGYVRPTPIATSRSLNEPVGAEVFCKCENLQRVGAFKFRGALNLISQLSDGQRKRGVVAFYAALGRAGIENFRFHDLKHTLWGCRIRGGNFQEEIYHNFITMAGPLSEGCLPYH